MYVVIQHEIDDADAFGGRGEAMTRPESLPEGVRPLQFLPDTTFLRAVCLWDGPSVDTVRAHVDGTLGDCSRNSYFEVNEVAALGLPATQPS